MTSMDDKFPTRPKNAIHCKVSEAIAILFSVSFTRKVKKFLCLMRADVVLCAREKRARFHARFSQSPCGFALAKFSVNFLRIWNEFLGKFLIWRWLIWMRWWWRDVEVTFSDKLPQSYSQFPRFLFLDRQSVLANGLQAQIITVASSEW